MVPPIRLGFSRGAARYRGGLCIRVKYINADHAAQGKQVSQRNSSEHIADFIGCEGQQKERNMRPPIVPTPCPSMPPLTFG